MLFHKINRIYDIDNITIVYKHIESEELKKLAIAMEKYRKEIWTKYEEVDSLDDVLTRLNITFFSLLNSLLPYSQVISEPSFDELGIKFYQIKKGFPSLWNKIVIHIAKSIKTINSINHNELFSSLCYYINQKNNKKISIVTKRALNSSEKSKLNNKVKCSVNLKYYTENGFRKDLNLYDETIYIGSPNYFNPYIRNTFKANYVTFFSYNMFPNYIKPKIIFEGVDSKNVYSTLYEHVNFGDGKQRISNISIQQENLLKETVQKVIHEQKELSLNNQDYMDARIAYLENDRFLFLPVDSRIRTLIPDSKKALVQQINTQDVEEDDFIVIRNERDSILITEVADQVVLKEKAKRYREVQREWKEKLRLFVRGKGLQKASDKMIFNYDIQTASTVSLRNWCNDDSIRPNELVKILKMLGFSEEKSKEIDKIMSRIQLAHRKAGRIISKKLMKELSRADIQQYLNEKGFYTFNSTEFNGASFNIERIILIEKESHMIPLHNLMKPIGILD